MPPPSEQPTPTHSPEKKSERRWSFSIWRLVVGLLIVLFGAQLLAQNYGWDWSVNLDITRLWPVVVILVGLSMITKGRVISAVVGSVLALSVIGIAAIVVMTQPSAVSRQTFDRTIAVDRDAAATSGTIKLDLGAADIDIRGGAAGLVNGRFVSNLGDLDLDTLLSGTDQRVTITTTNEHRGWPWFGNWKNDLDLRLTNDLPVRLDIDSGAASLTLDFTAVKTESVTIDAGASSITLTVGDQLDRQDFNLSSGASSIDVTIPKTVTGVRLNLDAGLSGKTLPSEFKKISDELYETTDYASAAKKLDLTIDAGASSIDIVWK